MADGYYDEVGWDDLEAEDESLEIVVSEPLKQVGRDRFPRHPIPENADRIYAQVWGHGEPIVTPRLSEKLAPGELELYAGALGRKLRYYAWSRVDANGTSSVDAESLAQDALIARWEDPRELSPEDIERFAIRMIRTKAINATEKAKNRATAESLALGYEAPEFVPQVLSAGSWLWVQFHLSKKAAEAVRLVLEEQYTQAEAAQKVGLKRLAVTRAFTKLRDEAQASDLGKDT